MKTFTETVPIVADIYNKFIQKIKVKGKTKSLEEMLLEEILEADRKAQLEEEENAVLKKLLEEED
jgi:diphthamide biosynthesis methyltransferase